MPPLQKLTPIIAKYLKPEFFASKITTVKKFLFSKGYEYDDYTANKIINGWYKEKQEMMAKASKLSSERMLEDMVDKFAIPVDELKEMKQKTIQLLKAKLNEINYKASERMKYLKWKQEGQAQGIKRLRGIPETIKAGEVIEILNAIKRELGEPLTIARHEHEVKDKKLTAEELEMIDMLDSNEALEYIDGE